MICIIPAPAGTVALVTGDYHACALLVIGGVDCWGYNGYGQLGTGDTTDRYTPTGVAGLNAVGLRAGGQGGAMYWFTQLYTIML